jgi:hypothetical protein
MTPSSLPPRGVFVPTSMIFDQQLPSSVLVTWIQLRCLAWKGWATPAFSLAEFASLIGIHPSRLEKHLDYLERALAMSLHPSGNGKFAICFPEQPGAASDAPMQSAHRPDVPIPMTLERQTSEPASYFPRQILGYLTITDDRQVPVVQQEPENISLKNDKQPVSLNRLQVVCPQEVS